MALVTAAVEPPENPVSATKGEAAPPPALISLAVVFPGGGFVGGGSVGGGSVGGGSVGGAEPPLTPKLFAATARVAPSENRTVIGALLVLYATRVIAEPFLNTAYSG